MLLITIGNYLVLLYLFLIIICDLHYNTNLYIFWFAWWYLLMFRNGLALYYQRSMLSLNECNKWNAPYYLPLYAEVAGCWIPGLSTIVFRIWIRNFTFLSFNKVQISMLTSKTSWRHWQRVLQNALTLERTVCYVFNLSIIMHNTFYVICWGKFDIHLQFFPELRVALGIAFPLLCINISPSTAPGIFIHVRVFRASLDLRWLPAYSRALIMQFAESVLFLRSRSL